MNALIKIKFNLTEFSVVKRMLHNFFNLITSEIFIWSFALIYLAIFNQEFCPGCGLGNSISYLFHGEIINSFNAHPLGIPALIILVSRIISLIKQEGSKNAKRVTINA